MKKISMILIASLSIFMTSSLYAYRFNSDSRCGECEYCSTCQCADLGVGRNTCMSDSKYCEAFGNIGAR